MSKIRSAALFVALVVATTAATTFLHDLGHTVAADKPAAGAPLYAQLSSAVSQKPKEAPPCSSPWSPTTP